MATTKVEILAEIHKFLIEKRKALNDSNRIEFCGDRNSDGRLRHFAPH